MNLSDIITCVPGAIIKSTYSKHVGKWNEYNTGSKSSHEK
jgi:hypothetical protein